MCYYYLSQKATDEKLKTKHIQTADDLSQQDLSTKQERLSTN